jgi:MFS family permease
MARLKQLLSTLVLDLWSHRRGGPQDDAVERNVRVNIYHGMVAIMALNLAAPFIGIFAVKSGASDLQVGLLSSCPAFVSLISMIPGGRFMDRQVRKKEMLTRFILLHRVSYLLIGTIPFFSPDRRAWLLVFAVAVMNAPASIANIGWQAFISKVIPMSRRADAFAARNRLMNLAGTIIVLITGRIIDIVGFPVGYQLVFACAFFMSLAEVWVLRRVDEPGENDATTEGLDARDTADDAAGKLRRPISRAEIASTVRASRGFTSLSAAVRDIVRHGRFVRYTLASIVFYLCWQTPWPLFTLYQVKVLGANNMWVSLLNLTNTGGALIGYGFWARRCNQYGNLKTLFLSSLGIFIVPLAYAVSKSLLAVAVLNLLAGAIFSGANLALFNQLLDVTPDENKATYIAYYTTAVNGAAVLAPMLGVSLLSLLGFFWAFLTCAGVRLGGSFVFLLVDRLEKRVAVRRSAGTSVVA